MDIGCNQQIEPRVSNTTSTWVVCSTMWSTAVQGIVKIDEFVMGKFQSFGVLRSPSSQTEFETDSDKKLAI